MNDSLRTWCN